MGNRAQQQKQRQRRTQQKSAAWHKSIRASIFVYYSQHTTSPSVNILSDTAAHSPRLVGIPGVAHRSRTEIFRDFRREIPSHSLRFCFSFTDHSPFWMGVDSNATTSRAGSTRPPFNGTRSCRSPHTRRETVVTWSPVCFSFSRRVVVFFRFVGFSTQQDPETDSRVQERTSRRSAPFAMWIIIRTVHCTRPQGKFSKSTAGHKRHTCSEVFLVAAGKGERRQPAWWKIKTARTRFSFPVVSPPFSFYDGDDDDGDEVEALRVKLGMEMMIGRSRSMV